MYSYDPLPENSIRVAELHPGQIDDDIDITLHPWHFDPTALLAPALTRYEALSYTWGTKDNPGKVQVQGVLDGMLEVTRNLDVALRHLRYSDQSRIMWIDAICIDQSNVVERGQQVAIMGDIYMLSVRVVVWLGPEENDSDNAMCLMDAIGAEVDVDFDKCEMKPTLTSTEPSLADEHDTIQLGEEDLCSLYHLFCRPWFERLWVRQEISLADESALVACGSRSVLWQVFRRAWACFFLKPKLHFKFSDQLTERMNSLAGLLFQDVGRYLPHLRESFGNAKCSDPRDRIYALLSLDEIMEDLAIVPDYSITAEQLYEDVTRKLLDRFWDLEVLTECEMPYGVGNFGGPSWVPDWSVGNPYTFQLSAGVVYASGPLVGPRFAVTDHQLRVIGIPIDTIRKLDRPPTFPNNGDRRLAVKQLLSGRDLSSNYVGGKTLLDAFVRLFTLDQFAESYSPPTTSFPRLAESTELIMNLASQIEGSTPLEEENGFLDRLEDVVSGRLILETTNNYIGLAPLSALPSDEICVILGCKLPMILRPMDDGRRKVVGPCFISGLNEGEAVLGPMPRGVRFVQIWDGDGYDERFVNDETGEVSEEDPRLQGWPTGDLTSVGTRAGSIVERVLVDVEYLRDRGVCAKYLELV